MTSKAPKMTECVDWRQKPLNVAGAPAPGERRGSSTKFLADNVQSYRAATFGRSDTPDNRDSIAPLRGF
jgi:hypothetical protein